MTPDAIIVPIGTRYIPLNRVSRRVVPPRLVRFEGREDETFADFGAGLRRLVPRAASSVAP